MSGYLYNKNNKKPRPSLNFSFTLFQLQSGSPSMIRMGRNLTEPTMYDLQSHDSTNAYFRYNLQSNLAGSHFTQHHDHQRNERESSRIDQLVDKLKSYGLTREYLINNFYSDHPDNHFSDFHKDILVYLVTGISRSPTLTPELRLTPKQALSEICGLTIDQLFTLEELYSHGLRGDDLRLWTNQNKGVHFTFGHKKALQTLLVESHATVQDAMRKMTGLTGDQAYALSDELKNESSFRKRL